MCNNKILINLTRISLRQFLKFSLWITNQNISYLEAKVEWLPTNKLSNCGVQFYKNAIHNIKKKPTECKIKKN